MGMCPGSDENIEIFISRFGIFIPRFEVFYAGDRSPLRDEDFFHGMKYPKKTPMFFPLEDH